MATETECEIKGALVAATWEGLLADPAGTISGRLTTEHAASSYGVPVLVLSDGRVLGAAEAAGYRLWMIAHRRDADGHLPARYWPLIDAARAAGYEIPAGSRSIAEESP